jgi:vacuolar-type H+-ATPase subunit D/Vma8
MKSSGLTLSFQSLISSYKRLQSKLVSQVKNLASKISQANPGSFILLQFQMSQVTQIGESISNLIYQVNSVISSAIRNQKVQ